MPFYVITIISVNVSDGSSSITLRTCCILAVHSSDPLRVHPCFMKPSCKTLSVLFPNISQACSKVTFQLAQICFFQIAIGFHHRAVPRLPDKKIWGVHCRGPRRLRAAEMWALAAAHCSLGSTSIAPSRSLYDCGLYLKIRILKGRLTNISGAITLRKNHRLVTWFSRHLLRPAKSSHKT